MIDRSAFKHVIPIQIRFNDIDKVNHVNNAIYHTYIELGRVNYFNQVLDREVEWTKQGFVLARTEIDYIRPVYLRDELFCFTKAVTFNTKSFTLHSIIAKKEQDLFVNCAYAIGTMVCMNFETNTSIVMPENWKNSFLNFEK